MEEDLEIKKILDKLPVEANALERAILCNTGTVQTLLSAIFRVPVEVEVIAQLEMNKNIYRWVKLVADFGEINKVTAALAMSIIPIELNDKDFLEGIRKKKFGIGQLLVQLKIRTQREILGFYIDEHIFSRVYRIFSNQDSTKKIDILITEVFPRVAFQRFFEVSSKTKDEIKSQV